MSFLKKYLPYLLLAIGFFIISVPLWLKVDLLPIRLWDEARNAVNALEMSQSHNWLIRTYNGFPEIFETKPPLLIWFQVVSLKIFGYNELAIRMPSVMFSILSLVVLYILLFKMTESKLASFGGALITATSKGFYGEHLGRFGDHEALLEVIVTGPRFAFVRLAQHRTLGRQLEPAPFEGPLAFGCARCRRHRLGSHDQTHRRLPFAEKALELFVVLARLGELLGLGHHRRHVLLTALWSRQ